MYVNPEFQLLKSVQLVWFFSVWAKFASSDIMILMFGFLFSIHIVFSENRVGHREWNVNVCFFLVWYCKRWKKKQEWCKCRLNIYAQKDFLFARNAEKSAPPPKPFQPRLILVWKLWNVIGTGIIVNAFVWTRS